MSEKRNSSKHMNAGEAGQALTAEGERRRFAHGAQVHRSSALLRRQTVWGIGGALAAFLLGRCALLFGARPLGIALLCAATHAIPYLYGGLVVSALTAEQGSVVLICAYTAALLIRILSRSAIELPGAGRAPRWEEEELIEDDAAQKEDEEPLTPRPHPSFAGLAAGLRAAAGRGRALLSHWFCESVYLRMMTACVCAFIVSLYTIISGGFLYYDLFGAFFAMITAPAATFLYAGLFGTGEVAGTVPTSGKRPTFRQLHRTAATAALAFSVLFALRELEVVGISLSAFAGFALTLTVARRRGILQGLAAGLLCGLAHAPVLVPSFALAALIFWLLARFSPLLAATAACAVGLAWGFYPLGLDALTALLPPFLAASMLVCAADKLLDRPTVLFTPLPAAERVEEAERSDVDRARAEQSEARMRELSEAFSSLAGVFYSLSDRLRRPGLLDLRRMCDRAFDEVCPDCPGRDLCWGADYVGTLTQLSRMAAALHERGRVTVGEVDIAFAERCESLPTLCERMSAECSRMTEAALRTEKAEIFAMDFDGLSQILSDALQEQSDDFYYDEELCEQVRRAMLAMDLRTQGVLVYGRRRRQIVARGVDASASLHGTASIHHRLEQVCGFALGEIGFDLCDTGVTMRVSSRPRFSARRVMRTMAAQSGICGDTVNVFDTERDYTYALISDGMGSGQEAAFTSGMCSLFLEKMLMAGNRTDTALRMLNSMIRQKGGGIGMECSATVDLMELDLLTGKAVFLKSGASPTYVRRDGCLFKLHAQTAPIGILRSVDAQRIAYDVMAGDVIIMLSDGVGGDGGEGEAVSEDCLWLLDLLSDGWQEDLDLMAETILHEARRQGSRDDLSAVLLEVLEE